MIDEQISRMWSIHTMGVVLSLKKETPDTCYNVDNLDHRCQSEMTNICDAII